MSKVVLWDGLSPRLLAEKLQEIVDLGCKVEHIHSINKTLYIVVYSIPEEGV
jgi:hypothetical protein